MKIKKINISFWIWFNCYCSQNNIQNVYKQSYINVQTNLYKKWQLKDGSIITAINPPLQEIIIKSQSGDNITASPFKQGRTDNSTSPVILEDIKKIYHQNNYSNQILHNVTQQIEVLSSKIEEVCPEEDIEGCDVPTAFA